MPASVEAPKASGAGAMSMWSLMKTWWPFLLGHILEWYDFAVYAYLSHAMKKNFFAGSALATWFGFSVTFLARPLGGIILGRMADAVGRRRATLISIVGMIVATAGQGVLPSERCCGPAAGRFGRVLLLALRLVQGLFVGGELPSIVAYFTETAPREMLAQATAVSTAASLMAFLIANGFTALLVQALGPEQMVQWGWRVPYLVPLVPGLISFWGRARLPETEEFLAEQRRLAGLAEKPTQRRAEAEKGCLAGAQKQFQALASFVGNYGWNALVGVGGCMGFATTFYSGLVWCPSYLRSHGLHPATAQQVGIVGNLVGFVGILAGARAGDAFGIAYVKLFGALYSGLLGFPLFYVLSIMPEDPIAGFLCVSLGFGSAAGIQGSVVYLFAAELFPTSQRALGFALSFNVALAAFGGAGGLAAQAALEICSLGPGVWISAVNLVCAAVLATGFALHKRGILTLTHLRPEPYFGERAATRKPELAEPGKPYAVDAYAENEEKAEEVALGECDVRV